MGRKKRNRRKRRELREALQQTLFEQRCRESEEAFQKLLREGLPKERAVQEGPRTYWVEEPTRSPEDEQLVSVLAEACRRPTEDRVFTLSMLVAFCLFALVCVELVTSGQRQWAAAFPGVMAAVVLGVLVETLSSLAGIQQEHDVLIDRLKEARKQDAANRV